MTKRSLINKVFDLSSMALGSAVKLFSDFIYARSCTFDFVRGDALNWAYIGVGVPGSDSFRSYMLSVSRSVDYDFLTFSVLGVRSGDAVLDSCRDDMFASIAYNEWHALYDTISSSSDFNRLIYAGLYSNICSCLDSLLGFCGSPAIVDMTGRFELWAYRLLSEYGSDDIQFSALSRADGLYHKNDFCSDTPPVTAHCSVLSLRSSLLSRCLGTVCD